MQFEIWNPKYIISPCDVMNASFDDDWWVLTERLLLWWLNLMTDAVILNALPILLFCTSHSRNFFSLIFLCINLNFLAKKKKKEKCWVDNRLTPSSTHLFNKILYMKSFTQKLTNHLVNNTIEINISSEIILINGFLKAVL